MKITESAAAFSSTSLYIYAALCNVLDFFYLLTPLTDCLPVAACSFDDFFFPTCNNVRYSGCNLQQQRQLSVKWCEATGSIDFYLTHIFFYGSCVTWFWRRRCLRFHKIILLVVDFILIRFACVNVVTFIEAKKKRKRRGLGGRWLLATICAFVTLGKVFLAFGDQGGAVGWLLQWTQLVPFRGVTCYIVFFFFCFPIPLMPLAIAAVSVCLTNYIHKTSIRRNGCSSFAFSSAVCHFHGDWTKRKRTKRPLTRRRRGRSNLNFVSSRS